MRRAVSGWRVVSWIAFAAFLLAGALNMMRVRGGFATNYLADLAGPAWLYLTLRGLGTPRSVGRLGRLVAATPERAAAVLFLGSTATEITQLFWPSGPFAGYFDPLDIVAFGLGILPFYLAERLG